MNINVFFILVNIVLTMLQGAFWCITRQVSWQDIVKSVRQNIFLIASLIMYSVLRSTGILSILHTGRPIGYLLQLIWNFSWQKSGTCNQYVFGLFNRKIYHYCSCFACFQYHMICGNNIWVVLEISGHQGNVPLRPKAISMWLK